MDVSIILVNYKTKDLTLNCIKSIYEKTTGVDFEIIVVDNNSQDGSAEAIEQEFQNVKVIYNKINVGFGAANNIAIKQAKGKYILCLNTDTFLINNAIKIMFDFMEEKANQQVGVCGGILYDSNNKKIKTINKKVEKKVKTNSQILIQINEKEKYSSTANIKCLLYKIN